MKLLASSKITPLTSRERGPCGTSDENASTTLPIPKHCFELGFIPLGEGLGRQFGKQAVLFLKQFSRVLEGAADNRQFVVAAFGREAEIVGRPLLAPLWFCPKRVRS